MRGHDELMERLAAADPVRDREPLTPEAQREADVMLARLLATPVTEPRRSRSPCDPGAGGGRRGACAGGLSRSTCGAKALGPW